MKYTDREKMAVANTILRQLGGNKFIAMTEAGNISYGTEPNGDVYLSFGFPGSRKANLCKIVYVRRDDEYTMNFYKFNRRTLECPTVETYNGIYADMLQTLFSDFTGLDTRL